MLTQCFTRNVVQDSETKKKNSACAQSGETTYKRRKKVEIFALDESFPWKYRWLKDPATKPVHEHLKPARWSECVGTMCKAI